MIKDSLSLCQTEQGTGRSKLIKEMHLLLKAWRKTKITKDSDLSHVTHQESSFDNAMIIDYPMHYTYCLSMGLLRVSKIEEAKQPSYFMRS